MFFVINVMKRALAYCAGLVLTFPQGRAGPEQILTVALLDYGSKAKGEHCKGAQRF
jgi:hypothetical protein